MLNLNYIGHKNSFFLISLWFHSLVYNAGPMDKMQRFSKTAKYWDWESSNIDISTYLWKNSEPFKRQRHKMVKQSQPTNCLSVFDDFMGLTLKRWNY